MLLCITSDDFVKIKFHLKIYITLHCMHLDLNRIQIWLKRNGMQIGEGRYQKFDCEYVL